MKNSRESISYRGYVICSVWVKTWEFDVAYDAESRNLLIISVDNHQPKIMNEMIEQSPPHDVSNEPFWR